MTLLVKVQLTAPVSIAVGLITALFLRAPRIMILGRKAKDDMPSSLYLIPLLVPPSNH